MSERACSVACGGRCCAEFFIHSHGREMIRAMADEVRDGTRPLDRAGLDVLTIDAMLIPVWTHPTAGQAYTCTHWDPVSGLCGIHPDRPSMCSDYPTYSGAPCQFCGAEGPAPRMPLLIATPARMRDEFDPDAGAPAVRGPLPILCPT